MATDPTPFLARIRTKFTDPIWDDTKSIPRPIPFTHNTSKQDVYEFVPGELLLTRENEMQQLQQLKDRFATLRDLPARRALANPFEKLGRSIFGNRAAVKLANVDAVFEGTLSQVAAPNRNPQELEPSTFTFVDVAAGPGAMSQYLQWRQPQGIGFGMTLVGDTDWDPRLLDLDRFTIYRGPSGTGNLYIEWANFIDMVISQQPRGVDLVVGDGGFDIETAGQFAEQELLNSRLLLTQILIGIGLTREHGNFVVKVFDTVQPITCQLLYACSTFFESVSVLKPISSRPANAERYVVFQSRIDPASTQEESRNLAEWAISAFAPDDTATHRIPDPGVEVPTGFVEWLRTINDESIQVQMEATQNILLADPRNPVQAPSVDLVSCLALWNLPLSI